MSRRAPQFPESFATIPRAAKTLKSFVPGASRANRHCHSYRLRRSKGTASQCPPLQRPLRGPSQALPLFRRIPRPGSPQAVPPPLVLKRPSRLFSMRASPPAPTRPGVRPDNSLWAHQRSCTLLFTEGGLTLNVGLVRSEVHLFQKEDPRIFSSPNSISKFMP